MENFFNRVVNDPNVRAARDVVANLPPPVKKAAKIGMIGVGTGIAVFATPPLLGFTASGVAAGSVAAAIQSSVFGAAVPAGSWFAIMQSIGATATIIPALVAGAGAAGVAGAAEAAQAPNPENDGGIEEDGAGEEVAEENGGLLQVADPGNDQGVVAIEQPANPPAKVVGIGVGTGVAVFVAPSLLGFTTAGVAAGSIAAAIQSAVYGGAVQAGSVFAIMQSVGATATVVPAFVAGSSAAGIAGAVIAAGGEDNGDGNGEGNNGGGGGGGGGNGGGRPGGGDGGAYDPGPGRDNGNRNEGEDGGDDGSDHDSDDESEEPSPYGDKNTHIQPTVATIGEDDTLEPGLGRSRKHKQAIIKDP